MATTAADFARTSAVPAALAGLPALARLLIAANKLTAERAHELVAQQQAAGKHVSFITELLQTRTMSERELAATISALVSFPLLDLDAVDETRLPRNVIEPRMMVADQVLPLALRGRRLVLAVADPMAAETLDRIKFTTQLAIDCVIVGAEKLRKKIERIVQGTSAGQGSTFEDEDTDFDVAVEEEQPGSSGDEDAEDAPVVRFFQKMLLDAIGMGASDLHFEPYEHNYRVRFRIDGQLRDIADPPVTIRERLASRIKVLSRLDISEKRIPQDGRMKLKVAPGKVIDFRVSTLPTLFGEKIVIRILDPASAKMGIDALGYDPHEKQQLIEAIHRPYGMILVTGPTGSGKTISLYTCLNLLNTPEVNISTAEDPAEINLPGINQVNVNDKAGLTFATALRAFLRQDPDVIMVGEIRDLETADIAIKAAQTGHMVMSTLHTNDAPSTLTRLRNMGVAPFNIASSVILITAQRLARRLCPHCKTPVDLPRAALLDAGFKPEELDGSWRPYKAVGCPECNGGYKGRVGIYQVMPISEEMQRIILADGSALDIEAQAAREGVRTLRRAGLAKVREGITSLEEIELVTNA